MCSTLSVLSLSLSLYLSPQHLSRLLVCVLASLALLLYLCQRYLELVYALAPSSCEYICPRACLVAIGWNQLCLSLQPLLVCVMSLKTAVWLAPPPPGPLWSVPACRPHDMETLEKISRRVSRFTRYYTELGAPGSKGLLVLLVACHTSEGVMRYLVETAMDSSGEARFWAYKKGLGTMINTKYRVPSRKRRHSDGDSGNTSLPDAADPFPPHTPLPAPPAPLPPLPPPPLSPRSSTAHAFDLLTYEELAVATERQKLRDARDAKAQAGPVSTIFLSSDEDERVAATMTSCSASSAGPSSTVASSASSSAGPSDTVTTHPEFIAPKKKPLKSSKEKGGSIASTARADKKKRRK